MNKKRLVHYRNAFTLVEIIIAVVLLAIIALTFSTVMAGSYSIQFREKNITKNAFKLEEQIELAIQDKKENAPTSSYSKCECFVEGVKVGVLEVVETGANHEFHTLITDSKPEQENLPKITSISVELEANEGSMWDRYFDYSPNVLGKEYLIKYHYPPVVNDQDYMQTVLRVYATEDPYNVHDFDCGFSHPDDVKPKFPDDYLIINQLKTEDESGTFELNLDQCRGRHIVVIATPITFQGKYGESASSKDNPIFIHGLSSSDNLLVHLDANAITDSTYYQGLKLKGKWQNLARHIVSTPDLGDATLLAGGDCEYITNYRETYPDTVYRGYGVRVPYSANKKGVEIDLGSVDSGPEKVTLFVLYRNVFGADCIKGNNGTEKTEQVKYSTCEKNSNFNLKVFHCEPYEEGGRKKLSLFASNGILEKEIELLDVVVYDDHLYTENEDGIYVSELGEKVEEYEKNKFKTGSYFKPIEEDYRIVLDSPTKTLYDGKCAGFGYSVEPSYNFSDDLNLEFTVKEVSGNQDYDGVVLLKEKYNLQNSEVGFYSTQSGDARIEAVLYRGEGDGREELAKNEIVLTITDMPTLSGEEIKDKVRLWLDAGDKDFVKEAKFVEEENKLCVWKSLKPSDYDFKLNTMPAIYTPSNNPFDETADVKVDPYLRLDDGLYGLHFDGRVFFWKNAADLGWNYWKWNKDDDDNPGEAKNVHKTDLEMFIVFKMSQPEVSSNYLSMFSHFGCNTNKDYNMVDFGIQKDFNEWRLYSQISGSNFERTAQSIEKDQVYVAHFKICKNGKWRRQVECAIYGKRENNPYSSLFFKTFNEHWRSDRTQDLFLIGSAVNYKHDHAYYYNHHWFEGNIYEMIAFSSDEVNSAERDQIIEYLVNRYIEIDH